MTRELAAHRDVVTYVLAAAMVCLFAVVVMRTAWVCDDAYITFRTVHNFVSGYGLRWNTAERVQAYTNPLWMFVVSALYWVTREVYYTSIFLSIAASVAAVILVAAVLAESPAAAVLGVTFLTFSRAFVDYSTSGLENPLTHLLLGLFLVVYFRPGHGRKRLFALSLGAAALALSRMDALLLVLPCLGYDLWKVRKAKCGSAVAVGFVPFALWEAFSVFYYGFAFPNTAYAKLNVGISTTEMAGQGLWYLLSSFAGDPLVAIAVTAAAATVFVAGRRSDVPVLAGIALHLAYVVWIGGDFMSGRFLSAPVFLAAVVLSRSGLRPVGVSYVLLLFLVVIVGLASPCCPVTSGADYEGCGSDTRGVTDERGTYYPDTALLRATRYPEMPKHSWVVRGLRIRREANDRDEVHQLPTIGFTGFYAGPRAHLLDQLGLADPLLARLPALRRPDWRAGHFYRAVPKGYPETLRTGENAMVDRKLGFYYQKLRHITRGRLLDPKRLLEIAKVNLGRYDRLVDRSYYACPPTLGASLSDVQQPRAQGTRWDEPGNHVVPASNRTAGCYGAAEIFLGSERRAGRLEVSLRGNHTYEIVFLLRDAVVAKQTVRTPRDLPDALAVSTVDIPRPARTRGFDKIRIGPLAGPTNYSFGHVRFLE